MKKRIAAMLLFLIYIVLLPSCAEKEEPAPDGQLGDNVYYYYDAEKNTVTIRGSGPMWDFDSTPYGGETETVPWSPFGPDGYADLNAIVIEEGITYLGQDTMLAIAVDRIIFPSTLQDSAIAAF